MILVFIPVTFSQTLPSNSHKTYTYEEERTRHMGEIEQLVRRAKKRDPDAFTELMQLHEKDMYRTASAILPQDADIADAIQETILTVWEKIDTLQKNRYFKTWMIRILINKCKDILRSGRRMICVEELPEQAAKDTVEAEANLEWKEALWGLDEKYRLIVVLFYAEGLRTAEIGKLLQLPDSTVRTRLARGREQLARYYAETEEGGGRK